MKRFRLRHLPRWLGLITHLVAFPTAHAALPWALSLTAVRHGWIGGRPSIGNLLGLIPVAVGVYVLFWSIRVHFTAAPNGWDLERTPHYPTPSYLLTNGPYRYSRNPLYLAELAVWLGWIVFYGSLVVLGVLAVAVLWLVPVIMRHEERGLEARFGEAYREYKRITPRWFGRAT